MLFSLERCKLQNKNVTLFSFLVDRLDYCWNFYFFTYFLHYLGPLRRKSSTLCDLQSDDGGEGWGAAGQKKPPQKSNGGKMRIELDEYLTESEATAQSGI